MINTVAQGVLGRNRSLSDVATGLSLTNEKK